MKLINKTQQIFRPTALREPRGRFLFSVTSSLQRQSVPWLPATCATLPWFSAVHKWNDTWCTHVHLASFAQCHIDETHPCYCMCRCFSSHSGATAQWTHLNLKIMSAKDLFNGPDPWTSQLSWTVHYGVPWWRVKLIGNTACCPWSASKKSTDTIVTSMEKEQKSKC